MEGILQLLFDAILLVVLVGAAFAWLTNGGGLRKAAGVAAILAFIGLGGALSAVIIPAGEVGVVTAFGRVEAETLPPGLHFRLPFANAVHIVDTRVQSHEFGTGDNVIEAASAEYQSVFLSGKFNYHVDGAYASVLFQTVGDDFAARIIDPAFKDIIKEVVPTYGISAVLPHRDEIRQRTKDSLNATLARYHIVVDDIFLANVGFSPEYSAAIEAKQVAQQQVETEKQITQQRIQQAAQAVEQAKGNAQAAIENAKGTAEANRLLTESLSEELIQYTGIQKLNPNVQVIYVPSDTNLFIQQPNATAAP